MSLSITRVWLKDAPFGTELPFGVEVQGLGPIGVSISAESGATGDPNSAGGTLTGYPHSSATNWKPTGFSTRLT